MWQFLLAAAVAGSTGFVANHLLHHPTNPPPGADGDDLPHYQPNPDDAIFRFSSPGSGEKSSKKEEEEESTRKEDRIGGNRGGFGDERRKVGRGRRRVHVCLKRRKTGKDSEARPKCGSCLSQGGSSFNWGLGLGLMYMMSAEKSEIRKLNTAVDETAKVVKELKSELYRRKLSGVTGEETDCFALSPCKESQKATRNLNDGILSGQIASCEGECASSVLTDDLQEFKMTQLEAELESELQKLPWTIEEASSTTDHKKGTDVSDEGLHEQADEPLGLHYSSGVSPHLLKQRLSHVLIEQQENQITELESELQSTRSRLNEKEAELLALKDCVRRLSSISISAGSDAYIMSDEDVEARSADEEEEEEWSKWEVGMKRHNLPL